MKLPDHHNYSYCYYYYILILLTLLSLSTTTSDASINKRPRNKRSSIRQFAKTTNFKRSLQPETNFDLDPTQINPQPIATTTEDPTAQCGLPLLRLPRRIVPNHYDLMIMPNLSSLTFEGIVQINFDVQELDVKEEEDKLVELNQIVLHADESLRIDNIWHRELIDGKLDKIDENLVNNKSFVSVADTSNYLDVVYVCRDPEYQLLVITLDKELKPQTKGQLYLTFAGVLTESLRGFYRSSYASKINTSFTTEELLNRKDLADFFMATTQFQATEARKAFPCFDEPSFKATFELNMVHQSDLVSLGNMELIYERVLPKKGLLAQLGGEQKLVKYAKTPPIPTYLVAFVVGKFQHLERQVKAHLGDKHQVTFRVYTPIGRVEEGTFALETAIAAFPLLEDYCLVELPLRKLDLVAVPDFEAGAMENWGLVTFKDQQLLVNPETTPSLAKAQIGATVIHELAHHWFGNLVTVNWWNDLWLQEGFATWFETRIMTQLYPELEFEFHYLLDSHINALNSDSYRSVHPMRPEVSFVVDPGEIDDFFDTISYSKGAAIIRTLHDDYLKPEPFKSAIRQYLKDRKYSTAISEDLIYYLELAERANEDKNRQHLPGIRRYLNSWLGQAGHPLVSVEIDGNSIKLNQTRFISNVANLNFEEQDQRWIILVQLLLSDGTNKKQEVVQLVMEDGFFNRTTSFKLPNWFDLKNPAHWLKLNANFSGFYRTLYSDQLFDKFIEPMRRRLISAADRLNLVDETHALVLANRVGSDRLIELLASLIDEDHGAVIESAATAYQALLKVFDNAENAGLTEKLLKFGRHLFGSMSKRQLAGNYKRSSVKSRMLEKGRSSVYSLLVHLNHPETMVEAVKMFKLDAATTDSENLPLPHLRASFYAAIARNGSDEQHNRLMLRLDALESREELNRLATALAEAEHEQRLEKLWNWLLKSSASYTGSLDRLDIVSAMVQAGSIGRKFVGQLLENWPEELYLMNKERPVISLIEELCIASQSDPFGEFANLVERQKNLLDWRSSRDYIKRMLDWQMRLRNSGAKQLERAIDHYFASAKV